MDYKAIKGFNYQPSYGRTAVEIWIDRFDSEVIQRELGLGRRYFPGINTVRLWLSPDAFFKDPTLFSQNFESVLTICDEFDLRTIPILFNNWHSIPDFGGICTEMINYWFGSYGKRGQDANYVFRPYLKAMFSDHGRDERILAWDMCNEPFNSGMSAIFVEWLNHTYAEGKQLGAGQPIGTSVGPELKHLRLIEPCSDILMIHPYFAASISWDKIKAFAIAKGKPVLATECCWGAIEDMERVKNIQSDLDTLVSQEIGFLAHALYESYVADLHRPEFNPFHIVSSASYMAFLNMDGSLRAGHDIFNRYC